MSAPTSASRLSYRAEPALGEQANAWYYSLRALEMLTENQSLFWIALPVASAAVLLIERGEVRWAVELYSAALRLPSLRNSSWFADLYRQPVETATAGLPGAQASAAQARGHAQDNLSVAKRALAAFGPAKPPPGPVPGISIRQ